MIALVHPFETVSTNQFYGTDINRLTPELNPSAQRCLTIFFTGDIAS
jgi:hypothetical protein